VGTRVVGILLLEAIDGGQCLFGLVVFPVDIGQIHQGLLRVAAKWITGLDGLKSRACVVPVAVADLCAGAFIKAFGTPAGGRVYVALERAAARDSQNDGKGAEGACPLCHGGKARW